MGHSLPMYLDRFFWSFYCEALPTETHQIVFFCKLGDEFRFFYMPIFKHEITWFPNFKLLRLSHRQQVSNEI